MRSIKSHKITGSGSKNKKEGHYADNKEFFKCLLAYRRSVVEAQKEGKALPQITEEIGRYFIKIAQRLASKPCFAGYSFRSEMIADGIENCIKVVNNYRIEEGDPQNPFSYFTQIIYWAFVRRIKREKASYYNYCKVVEHTISNHENPKVAESWHHANYKPIQDFTDTFETSRKKKLAGVKAKKLAAKEEAEKT